LHTFCFTKTLTTSPAFFTAVNTYISNSLVNFLRMSKQNKKGGGKHGDNSKGKTKKSDVATPNSDDDFDSMLADFRASDLPTSINTNTKAALERSSISSSSSGRSSTASGSEVTKLTIIQASIKGDVAQLRRWARQGIRVSSAEPLCQALLKNQVGAARCLVNDLGADVNQTNEEGLTPLCIAALKGDLEMVRCLVADLGADVDRANNEGISPVHMAVQVGNLEMVQCLVMEYGANVDSGDEAVCTPLYVAAQDGHVAVVRSLVKDLGADINRRSKYGWTLLNIAAQNGHLDVVRCLVEELGADVNEATGGGVTSLMIAVENLHHKIVRTLLKQGADAQASHNKYGTAVSISRFKGDRVEETAYLNARTHCANPSCENAGLKKCERCLQAYFCGIACIRAHWSAHKAECKAAALKLKAAGELS
jgi:ankyrin repeat protein